MGFVERLVSMNSHNSFIKCHITVSSMQMTYMLVQCMYSQFQVLILQLPRLTTRTVF